MFKAAAGFQLYQLVAVDFDLLELPFLLGTFLRRMAAEVSRAVPRLPVVVFLVGQVELDGRQSGSLHSVVRPLRLAFFFLDWLADDALHWQSFFSARRLHCWSEADAIFDGLSLDDWRRRR